MSPVRSPVAAQGLSWTGGAMRFARVVFLAAGVYGLAVLAPQLLFEQRIGEDTPPAITHPEFFYGFIGVGLAWQAMFLVIGWDPVRFRPAMVPAVLEKAAFTAAVAGLWAAGRAGGAVLVFASIDALLGVLFVAAYLRTPRGWRGGDGIS